MLDKKQKKIVKRELLLHNFKREIRRRWNIITACEYDLQNERFMNTLPSVSETQKLLCGYVNSDVPFLSLRFGLYEYLMCYQYLEKICGLRQSYSDYIRYHIQMDAGIRSDNEEQLDQYCEFVLSRLDQVDVMSYWKNIPPLEIFGRFYSSETKHIDVNNLYPFPFLHNTELPYWQQSLFGKRVMVVSSFAETIRQQYIKRKSIWKNADHILPEMDLITYQSIVTNGGMVDDRFENWQEAVRYLCDDILTQRFDLVLISAGGYGMPLAIELHRNGRKALQWGGCFQLWFGIMGGRWCDDPGVKYYLNKSWVYPSSKETPPLSKNVNDSSYWNPEL